MSARDAILEAAAAIAAEDGVTALGVENVNQRAGVSKGAFFYHFKTKEEMIHALVEHVSAEFIAGMEADIATGMRFTDALIDASFREVSQRGTVIGTLIAAISYDRALAERVRPQIEGWTQRMCEQDGLSRDRADLVRLALDGMMISTLLYSSHGDDAYLRRARDLIRIVAEGADL